MRFDAPFLLFVSAITVELAVMGAWARPLSVTQPTVTFASQSPDAAEPSLSFRQTPARVYLPERVYFNPNNGEDNKVEDYVANVYFGEVDLAKADPVLAAAGAAVRAVARHMWTTYFYDPWTNSVQCCKIRGLAVSFVRHVVNQLNRAYGHAATAHLL